MAAKPGVPGFVHLHVHSSYSLLEGALTIARLAELAKKDRQPALALTDTDNMFGALEFSEKLAGYGIQPIVGCSLGIDFGDQENRNPALEQTWPRIVLLAAAEEGYRSLMRLCSRAYLDTSPQERPHLKLAALRRRDQRPDRAHRRAEGPARCRRLSAAKTRWRNRAARRCRRLFGDRLYVELQRHGMPAERTAEARLDRSRLCARHSARRHQRAVLCHARGLRGARCAPVHRRGQAHRRQRTSAADARAPLQEPRRDGGLVRRSAGGARLDGRDRRALRVSAAHDGADPAALYRSEAKPTSRRRCAKRRVAGLKARLARYGVAHGHTEEEYNERLDFELGVIARMKYAGYFLIVADFIQWAKAQGIPVGPGRGSGAGSLVAYALTITDLDPIRFGLLFERFLNPERVSMPDFDVDFCQDRRDEVIRYVQARNTAATRSPRSSPSAPCRRAACCATSAACCKCPTGRSTSCASSCRRIRRTRSRSSAPSRMSRDCRPSATAIR